MNAELRFINGPLAGQSIVLPPKESLALGRASSCEITVKGLGISRTHCRFEHDGQDCHLVDLGSVNGTFVNGERTPRHILQDGDEIRVGQVEALFLWAEATATEIEGESDTVLVEGLARRRFRRCDQCAAPLEAPLGSPGEAEDERKFCGRCEEAGSILGRQFGYYRIDGKIAHGGMGAVYKGFEVRDRRVVAVKILSSEVSHDSRSIERFLRGARTAMGLVHQHVVQVEDVGESQGIYYIAMEHVDGPTALDAMTTGRLSTVRQVLRIGIQVTQALGHAFEKRIVHRDIKPSNVMITRSNITKLTDVGLAKCLDEAGVSGITGTGVSMGTVDFMPPEQIRDARTVDHRADIYSLGATLFHLLTQRTPFSSPNVVAKMKLILAETPPSPADLRSEIPAALSEVILRTLAKSPDERYQTPKELLEALLAVRKQLVQEAGT